MPSIITRIIKLITKKIKFFLNKFNLVLINKNKLIVELTKEDEKLISLVSKYSMTPKIRIYNLLQSLKDLEQRNVQGDYVECGVWKGGNILLFKKFMEDKKNIKKKIYAYDTFEGMTDPDENDLIIRTSEKAKDLLSKSEKTSNIKGICKLDDVKKYISTHSDLDNIIFVKGDVENTLDVEENLPEKICLLRLDTDFYRSTKKELEKLYNRVPVGGIIIIDDYGHWSGCKKAVDEFFSDKYVCDALC